MVGDILSISHSEILYLLLAFIAVGAFWYFTFNKLNVTSINSTLAKSRGINTKLIDNIFVILIAIIVMISIRWIGILLINSLLILPAASSRNIAKNMRSYHLIAIVLSLFTGIAGLIMSYYWNIPTGPMMYVEINNWDDSSKAVEEPLTVGMMPAKEEFFEFYKLNLLEGEFISDKNQENEVVIDENTCRKFGWKRALGKSFYHEYNGQRSLYKVVGVVRNFSYRSPTSEPGLIAFQHPKAQDYLLNRASILFKFREGTWNECRATIEKLYREEFPNAYMRLFNEEEEYNKYLRSEDALMKLLSFVSLVCVIISVFGVFSLVTLSCEQRQKEIAIRKVNGAQIHHILQMFFQEYLLLLIIAAVIAFPTGYVVMRRWIDSYVRQTSIDGWVYISIFVVIAIILLLSIIWRVWKAARQNPAEIIKSE